MINYDNIYDDIIKGMDKDPDYFSKVDPEIEARMFDAQANAKMHKQIAPILTKIFR